MDLSKDRPNKEEYFACINLVLDYVQAHIDETLCLERLAEFVNFSPFHFRRIFTALVGETLNQFVKRIRLEKAASQLIYNPKKSITDIAFDCGFSSSVTFARAFREACDMSASRWRKDRIRHSFKDKLKRKVASEK